METVKLIEDSGQDDEGPRVEALVDIDEAESEVNQFDQFWRFADQYLLAPARIAWDDWRAQIGLIIMLFFAFMATVWAAMFPPMYRNDAPTLVPPFSWKYTQEVFGITVWRYPLGTSQFGQGILTRIVNAAPEMAELVIAGAFISIAMAVVIGVTAGYKGGFVDNVLMGFTDIVLTIPGLPLIVLLAAVFKPQSQFILGMLLAIDNWPGLARTLRSQVLTIREESYVEANRAMDISTFNILGKDITPQLMPYILINAATAGKRVITEAVALYFLGFLPSSLANWGLMLDEGYRFGAVTDPSRFYLIFWPMLALAMLSFGLVMLAQGLDRVFNPRLRARYGKTAGGDSEET